MYTHASALVIVAKARPVYELWQLLNEEIANFNRSLEGNMCFKASGVNPPHVHLWILCSSMDTSGRRAHYNFVANYYVAGLSQLMLTH